MRFIKAASSRTEGGPAWSDKVNDDDELDASGDTNTAKGGRADGTRRRRGGSRDTMERRVLVRHLERPHAQKKLTTAGDTRFRSLRRRPRVPFARDEQRQAAGRRAATQGS
ncbi:hypothetical protein PsorP6_019627 [Peronosclerospora sorghi]|nr:hypothetical protein PsorP6_019512 [Peronosclerospora sorghi]KAI9895476.1 hypothetical protein PsorP6_019627 [Peronosclerospora sorghi]